MSALLLAGAGDDVGGRIPGILSMDDQTQTIAATASITGLVAWIWRRVLDKPDEQAKEAAAQRAEMEKRLNAMELRQAKLESFVGSERGGMNGKLDELSVTMHKVANAVQLLTIEVQVMKSRTEHPEG